MAKADTQADIFSLLVDRFSAPPPTKTRQSITIKDAIGVDTEDDEGTTTITIRVAESEKRGIKRQANLEGLTITDWVKRRIQHYQPSHRDIPVVNRQTYSALSNIRRDLLRAAKEIEQQTLSFPDTTPDWAIALQADLKQVRSLVGQVQADLAGREVDNP